MSYTEQLFSAQRAQLSWAEEARAARCDWLATEPGPDDQDYIAEQQQNIRCAHVLDISVHERLVCPGTFRVQDNPCFEPVPAGLPLRKEKEASEKCKEI